VRVWVQELGAFKSWVDVDSSDNGSRLRLKCSCVTAAHPSNAADAQQVFKVEVKVYTGSHQRAFM